MSVHGYIEDNDGCWPSFDAWNQWHELHPTLPLCPNTETFPPEVSRHRDLSLGIPGYALNSVLIQRIDPYEYIKTGKTYPVEDSSLRFPASTVALCEEAPGLSIAGGPDPYAHTTPYPYGQVEGWKRHEGGGNYIFCDGHLHWYQPESVAAAFPPERNDGTHPTFDRGDGK